VQKYIFSSTAASNSAKHNNGSPGERDIPDCWSSRMFLQKKNRVGEGEREPWLLVQNKETKMQCMQEHQFSWT
jgi:hypothetical protein